MKLYSHQVSPFTRLVQVVLNITKTECESQMIDLFNGEQKEEWYLKIHPKHLVPALVLDDGSTLTESAVIAKYIVRKSGGHSIYPAEPAKAALVDVASGHVAKVEWTHFPFVRFFGREPEEGALEKVEASYAKIRDMHFDKGQTWLANGEMSIADIQLATRLSMAIHVGDYNVEEKFPEIMKGYNEIVKMPEWQSVEKTMVDYIATLGK